MPELPDVENYVAAIAERANGRRLTRVELVNPFLLRTVEPSLESAVGRSVVGVRRLGKCVVLELEGELFLVIHLMIAGRLHWTDAGEAPMKRARLAAFVFESGVLSLTEAGTKRRASLRVVAGKAALRALDRGGLEPLVCSRDEFTERLRAENHTLKRALTDPRLFAGIGNAYSDEILHSARLSPMKLSRALDDEEIARLHAAVVTTLREWTDRLRGEANGAFPREVTAFRPEMAVHGRFGRPCPVCATPVQRIVRGETECNYCPKCQTEGRVLADRVLSRLLKDDWPKTVEEL
jgi:formamidopyrimidine-DNA glycosylase